MIFIAYDAQGTESPKVAILEDKLNRMIQLPIGDFDMNDVVDGDVTGVTLVNARAAFQAKYNDSPSTMNFDEINQQNAALALRILNLETGA